ncbi:MAG: hypothetical protein JWR26_2832 [Pedosphaera sp.]|nr:hypothetical protein [Pedosphaera sp.]
MNIKNSSWLGGERPVGGKGRKGPKGPKRRDACAGVLAPVSLRTAIILLWGWGGGCANRGFGFSRALGEVKLLRSGTSALHCKGEAGAGVFAHKGTARVAAIGEGAGGDQGWQTTRHDPPRPATTRGYFIFCVGARPPGFLRTAIMKRGRLDHMDRRAAKNGKLCPPSFAAIPKEDFCVAVKEVRARRRELDGQNVRVNDQVKHGTITAYI